MVTCIYKGGAVPRCVVVDAMLGWLVRWLRIVGVDARYGDLPDEELASTPCLLVTRDRELFKRRRGPAVLFLTDDHVAWISALIRLLGVEPLKESRCPKCNFKLVEIPCEEAERRVSHAIHSNRCWVCPNCGSTYWIGSHWVGIRKTIEAAIKRQVICQGSLD
ncbi:MAG: Mut7-C RNAse domain-containing protein [Thermoproteus sp.]